MYDVMIDVIILNIKYLIKALNYSFKMSKEGGVTAL